MCLNIAGRRGSSTTEKVGESLTRSIHSDGECGSRAVPPSADPAAVRHSPPMCIREVVTVDSGASAYFFSPLYACLCVCVCVFSRMRRVFLRMYASVFH